MCYNKSNNSLIYIVCHGSCAAANALSLCSHHHITLVIFYMLNPPSVFFRFISHVKAPLSSTMPLVHLSHSPSYYLTWLREWERERASKRDNEVTTKENALISFNQALLLSRIVAGRQAKKPNVLNSFHSFDIGLFFVWLKFISSFLLLLLLLPACFLYCWYWHKKNLCAP